jgi:uncharacterized membrane protein
MDIISVHPRTVRSKCTLNTARCMVILLVLTSCTVPPPPRKELDTQTFSSIAIISPTDISNVASVGTRSEKMKEGVGIGVASGSLGGMLVGAAACGPYLYGLCVIGLGAAGIIAGGTSGAIYGFSGISDSAARDLKNKLEDLNHEKDLQALLTTHVKTLVPDEMLTEPEVADIQAILVIESIEFLKSEGEVYLETLVRLTFATTESRRVPEHGSRVFMGRSQSAEIDVRLDNDSDEIELAIKKSLNEIAIEIALVLTEHWSPSVATDVPGE